MAQADLSAFFMAYSERINEALAKNPKVDTAGMASAFAETFIEAGPAGVSCGRNDEKYLEMISKGLEFYRSIGTQPMRVLAIEGGEIKDGHYMARVFWHADYKKADGSALSLEFDVVYFLQRQDDGLKVFGYVTGDERQAYKDAGLI